MQGFCKFFSAVAKMVVNSMAEIVKGGNGIPFSRPPRGKGDLTKGSNTPFFISLCTLFSPVKEITGSCGYIALSGIAFPSMEEMHMASCTSEFGVAQIYTVYRPVMV